MESLWFWLVAWMIAMYVILDGYDLGAGVVHLLAARTEEEKRHVLAAIGPFWDGNEVWLIAAGGTLFFAFPTLYASSFMGFYLPLIIVLWLLMGRGLSIELRNHVDSPMWRPLFDTGFAVSSGLLTIFLGAALGNVVRGVPLDNDKEFFLPLWTDWLPGPEPGILDAYTLLTGLTAFAALSLHGALWIHYKTPVIELQQRVWRIATVAWAGTLLCTAAVTAYSFNLRPELLRRFLADPVGLLFPIAAAGGLLASIYWLRRGEDLKPFAASSLYLGGMLASVAFSLFPNVLPSSSDPAQNLTIYNTAASAFGHQTGLYWWIPGMLLATGYSIYLHWRFRDKTTIEA